MKNLMLAVAFLCNALMVLAQAPQAINYQAVVRNPAGDVIKNQNVRFRLSITEGQNGSTVYSETHSSTTNTLGLVNLTIGLGTPASGTFSSINWGTGQKFLKIEIDATGGTIFALMGTQQFVSVPYALQALNATNAITATNATTATNAITANSVPNQWLFNANGIHYNLGKVGIGTITTPTSLLTIEAKGDGQSTIEDRHFLTLNNTSISSASSVSTTLKAGSGAGLTNLAHHSTTYSVAPNYADFGQLSSTGLGLVLQSRNGILRFETGNNGVSGIERMRIAQDGNIGIGSKTPDFKMVIENPEESTTGIDDGRTLLQLHNKSLASFATTNLRIKTGNTNNVTMLAHYGPTYTQYPNFADYGLFLSTGSGLMMQAPAGNIRFMTGPAPNNVGINDRMIITNDGNVGIGTQSPKTKFEVTGGDVYVNDATKGIILKSANGSCWRVTIDNTGNFVRTSITCPN